VDTFIVTHLQAGGKPRRFPDLAIADLLHDVQTFACGRKGDVGLVDKKIDGNGIADADGDAVVGAG
jgi:hypothetical protein